MAWNAAGLPSTADLLENLGKQDDSKALDILAYLLELQVDQTGPTDPRPQVLQLARQLYSFVFCSKSQGADLKQRQSEAIELVRIHGKLPLSQSLLSILAPDLIILLKISILYCKDDYGPEITRIYGLLPADTAIAGNSSKNADQLVNPSGFDIDAELQRLQAQASLQLNETFESPQEVWQSAKDRLGILEGLLSEKAEQLSSYLWQNSELADLLVKMGLSFIYVTDHGVVLSAIRVLRRMRHLYGGFAKGFVGNVPSLDSVLFDHLRVLLQSQHRIQNNAGYHLWVGILDNADRSINLEDFVNRDNYWEYILNGLDKGSTETKKICLHILWTTIQQLAGSLNLRTFRWDMPNKAPLLNFWKTYIAFTEMIALDGSVNQLRLASTELEGMFTQAETLRVPGPWLVVLLSQGFAITSTNDMSSRLSSILLQFKTQALWWIRDATLENSSGSALEFFRKILLPQTFKTPNFNVSVLADNTCEHGNELSSFVQNSLTIAQSNDEVFQALAEALFDGILNDNRKASAGQLYVLKGILSALAGQPRCLSASLSERIIRVAGSPTDNPLRGDLKSIMCFQMYMKLRIVIGKDDTLQSLGQVFGIFRNRLHLLDEKRISFIADELQINTKNVSGLAEFLLQKIAKANAQATEGDIGLCALLAAISLNMNETSVILDYPKQWPEPLRKQSQDIYDSILVQLLRYGADFQKRLQNISSVQTTVTDTFREIFNQTTHTPHIPDIGYLIPLLSTNEKNGIHQSAMGILQDISENWTAGFSNVEDLLSVLRFNLKLCIATAGRNGPRKCPDNVINAIITRTSSFCEEIHDKVKGSKDFQEVVAYFLELIEVMIQSRSELPTDLGYYVLTTLQTNIMPYIDGLGFSIMLGCIHHILLSCPDSLQLVENLGETLQEWAKMADEERLGRNQKSNQIKAIELILHPVILDASVATGPTLIKICKDLQENMTKRRGLAPALARALCYAFDTTPSTFCREHGFTEILHEFLIPTAAKVDDNNFIVEDALARMFDEVTETTGSYEKYHGEREKTAQARIFDLLARFDYDDAIQELWAKTLLDEVFEPWTEIDINDPDSLKIVQKWKKTAQLQIVLLLERFITDDDAEDHLIAIYTALSREASPRFKFLLEWIAFRCIIKFPNLSASIWERFENLDNAVPGYVVSLLRLAHSISQHLEGELKEKFFAELVTKAIPCATSNKVTIRHEGAELIPELWEEATQLGYKKLTSNPLFQSVHQYVLDSPFRKVMVPSTTGPFDPIEEFTLVGVLGGGYITSDSGGEIIPIFLKEDFLAFGADRTKRFIPIGENPTPYLKKSQDNDKTPQPAALPTGFIQTKGGDWDIKNLLERQDAVEGRLANRRQSHDIHVVASLVDNAFNLGGISRVCELSGVRELYMNTKGVVLKSKEFTSVSVSSENWIPITELKRSDIAQFLSSKREEGYSIVGIEQTDRSIILGSSGFNFPAKTILVIGAEKTGIPPELLAEMDICVEVKQFGETRSMNVQTVTAVVLYEYIRQNGGIQ